MTLIFEELDFQQTPLGEISLRKRSEPRLNNKIIYEVKLNEEFLMSSLFVEAEVQLAKLGLAAIEDAFLDCELDVVVGGLGLGHTALAALENPSVRSVKVIDIMEPVINWHRQGLVPLGKELSDDLRCEFVLADFFKVATANNMNGTNNTGFGEITENNKVHAVLLDIDHSPDFWLNPGNRTFYSEVGLSSLADKLHSKGVFGLWSDDPPADDFMDLLDYVFASSESHIVSFPNPYTGNKSTNTVYLARKT